MQLLLLLLIIVSIYYVVSVLKNDHRIPVFFRALGLLLLMFTIYSVAEIISGDIVYKHGSMNEKVSIFEYLKSIYISLLPIYAFYHFARKGLLNEKTIRNWGFVLLPIVTLIFLYEDTQIRIVRMLNDTEDITNNFGYLFLSLIPIIAFYRDKNVVQYFLLSYCMLFIIMGMKRGAIVIGLVCMLIYITDSLFHSKRKRKTGQILVTFCFLLAIYYIISYYFQNSDYFNYRFNETLQGESSGRDEIYSRYYNYFINSSFISFFIGHGADATLKFFGQYAHNDWLEIAINNGIIGVFLYMYFWLAFYRDWKRTRNGSVVRKAMGFVLMISFAKTLFSMSYNDMKIFDTMVLGYCLAQIAQRNSPSINNREVAALFCEKK